MLSSTLLKKMMDLYLRAVNRPGLVFVSIASLFGMLLIILMPPFTGADEEAHFVRAYGITQGNIIMQKNENVLMPTTYSKTLGCLQKKQPVGGATYTYRYSEYGKDKAAMYSCASQLSMNSTMEEVATTAGNYSPLTYVPQIIAILIGRIFNLSVITTSYLVRVSVLLAYMALVYTAIRILPYRKWALVGIALLPHALQQVTNPGGDYILIGATAIFIASILKSRESLKPPINQKTLLTLTAISGALIIVPKGIFPGICFLPLVCFFGGLRNHVGAKIAALIGIVSLGVLWQKFSYIGGAGGAAETTDLAQSFPFAFVKTMFHSWSNTDFLYVKPGLGLDGNIGMPAIIITLINIAFGFYLFVAYERNKQKKMRASRESLLLTITGLVVAAGVIVGSFAGLYIAGAYMQKGDMIIYGVQARYFYPAFALLALLPLKWRLATTKIVYSTVVVATSLIALSAQLLVIAVQHSWIG